MRKAGSGFPIRPNACGNASAGTVASVLAIPSLLHQSRNGCAGRLTAQSAKRASACAIGMQWRSKAGAQQYSIGLREGAHVFKAGRSSRVQPQHNCGAGRCRCVR